MNKSSIPQTANGTQPLPAPGAVSQTPGKPAPNGYSRSGQSHPVPLVYTVEEAAAVLRISTKSVRRLLQRGFFTNSKALRKILIPRTQIENFLNQTCARPNDKC
jgi:excisionase family DNA binding protein